MASNKNFRTRLRRLFSTQVVTRSVGGKQIKVYDASNLQSVGGGMSSYRSRYSGFRTSGGGYYTQNMSGNYAITRHELYRDYEAMDEDPILASALDIYADEVTMKSVDGFILNINSADDSIKKTLYNLFYDILNIEFNLWSWVRNACKYGDFYLALDLDEEYGVVNVIPISSYDMSRLEGADAVNPEAPQELNPYSVRFQYQPLGQKNPFLKEAYDYFEVAHFRILSDTNFLPYGRSMIEPARKEYKRLALMEDAMMIHRIMRAPQRRVYKVSVGSLDPKEIEQYMKKIITDTQKIPYVDEKTGQYNLQFNLQNMLEDIYIPIRGGDTGTDVSTLEGMSNDGFIDDVDYIKNKMMAALKIPRAFLGYDENLDGKALLSAEDIRFARTIERIQSIIVSELEKIATVHLFIQGYEGSDIINFDLSLNNPSIVYERQRVEVMTEKLNLVNLMKDSKMVSRKRMYESILGLSHDEWSEEEALILQDQAVFWRLEQMAAEGNDPKKTGEAKGTPHSIAKMQLDGSEEKLDVDSLKDPNEDRENEGGRPKSPVKFGTDRDKSNGRDPLGYKRVMQDTGFTSKESVKLRPLIEKLEETFKTKKLDELLDS